MEILCAINHVISFSRLFARVPTIMQSDQEEELAHDNEVPPRPPLSDVGSARAPEKPDDLLSALLDLQNQNMKQLIEAIKLPSSPKLSLPDFNPEHQDTDPRAWCSTVDLCLSEKPLQGGALVIALSKALKGTASTWLSQVSYAGITWDQFKDIFLARFDSNETKAATLINLNNSRPKENECLAAYGSRLMSTIMTAWKDLKTEEIAVSYVLAHLAQFDNRLQRLAYTTDITSRNKLQQELKAFSILKRKQNNDNELPSCSENKRFKPTGSNDFRCKFCGIRGHKATFCRKRKYQENLTKKFQPNSDKTSQSSKSVVCFRCGERGHISTQCASSSGSGGAGKAGSSARSAAGGGSALVASERRRVDTCEIRPVTGRLNQSGQSFSFCYDSGAECSLIKESFANR